jgi:hypothetical protein
LAGVVLREMKSMTYNANSELLAGLLDTFGTILRDQATAGRTEASGLPFNLEQADTEVFFNYRR